MEEWKEVEGFSKYEVSNTGKIREKESLREIPQPLNNNYLCANMYRDDGVKVLCKVHRVVALAFIPNTENVHNVDHKENRLNNSVDNLQWRPKKVREVKPEKTLTFLDKTYTYDEFCKEAGCEISTLKERLKAAWTIRECYTGIKAPRNGYEDGSYWYPTKWVYKEYIDSVQASNKLKRKVQIEQERLEGIEQRKQNRLDYRKFGVGNFVNYPIPGIVGRKQLKVYRVWSSMLGRCYATTNQSYDRYGGRGVYVCDEWLEFQNFAVWYYAQYQEDDWHIDKDILSPADDVRYSPETCVFIPAILNTLLASMQDQMRDLPMGVARTKTKGVYSCQYISEGNRYHQTFKDIYAAGLHYKENKEAEIKRLTETFKDKLPESVYQFFINYNIVVREEFKIPS